MLNILHDGIQIRMAKLPFNSALSKSGSEFLALNCGGLAYNHLDFFLNRKYFEQVFLNRFSIIGRKILRPKVGIGMILRLYMRTEFTSDFSFFF